MNLKEKCRELNMPYMVVIKRIARGWTLEKALNTPRTYSRRERIFYKGKPLRDLFSEEDVAILRTRIRKGMSVEDAVETPIRRNKKTGLDRSKMTDKEYMKEYKRLRT
jgi:hypothetical protein